MKMKADAVIVGTGVGGLFSALNLPRDKKIIMITKSDLESSDSFLAQGGICMLHDEDDYDSYFEDTMKAGHYENRKESVDIMIRSSREIIQDLIGYGVEFQKESDVPEGNSAEEGNQEKGREPETDKPLEEIYAFTREGAHSRPRILFHEDVTGKEITEEITAEFENLFPNAAVILTLGKKGSIFKSEKDMLFQPSYCGTVKDTTGAGDTYTGFFIANYIKGVSPQECMRIAAMASTVQISRDGAAIAIPTKQEVLNALKNHCR
mgnify:CR=1 FL=1